MIRVFPEWPSGYYVEDGERFHLTDNYKAASSFAVIWVREGFETDFASVPRLMWAMFPRVSSYGAAAVVHDFLYAEGKRGRKFADDVFLDLMKKAGVGWFKRNVMYGAVRAFGGFYYAKAHG